MRTARTIESSTRRTASGRRWIAAVTASALTLAACGSGDDDATTTQAAAETTAAQVAVASLDLALDPAQRSDVLSADQCPTELH